MEPLSQYDKAAVALIVGLKEDRASSCTYYHECAEGVTPEVAQAAENAGGAIRTCAGRYTRGQWSDMVAELSALSKDLPRRIKGVISSSIQFIDCAEIRTVEITDETGTKRFAGVSEFVRRTIAREGGEGTQLMVVLVGMTIVEVTPTQH